MPYSGKSEVTLDAGVDWHHYSKTKVISKLTEIRVEMIYLLGIFQESSSFLYIYLRK